MPAYTIQASDKANGFQGFPSISRHAAQCYKCAVTRPLESVQQEPSVDGDKVEEDWSRNRIPRFVQKRFRNLYARGETNV